MSTELIAALHPMLEALVGLDLSNREQAELALAGKVDANAQMAATLALLAAHEAGTLTPKVATPTLSFGRVAKPSEATLGFAIDAVDIAGAGAVHTHPQGEVSWLIPLEGTPVFEGKGAGFVVLPPGSRHVPTVEGGRMLIAYFLPDGAVDWS